jgi:hypothetical protein
VNASFEKTFLIRQAPAQLVNSILIDIGNGVWQEPVCASQAFSSSVPAVEGTLMNGKWLCLVFAVLASVIRPAQANIVGYVNLTFQTGANWFANPLLSGNDSLNIIMPTAPDGTTISLWNPTADLFTTTSTFDNGAWSDNLVLDPGTGALLNAPSQFINTFVGTAENFDGTIATGAGLSGVPPVFSGPNGVYFLSSKGPAELSGNYVFLDILGRNPNNGEQVTTLNALTQTYSTTTFLNGAWSNGDPTLAVGGAAMINIGPVPEPSSFALMLAGLASVIAFRRQVSKAQAR